MLDIVRSKQKSFLIKIAFVVIILSFVIGYTMLTAPTDQRSDRSRDVAARVNGDVISFAAYQNVYSNLYSLYQSIYQGAFDANLERQLNLPRQAMQQLIEEQLLVQMAEKLNLRVTNQELVNSIAAYDAFQVNGQFNRDRYVEVLSYQRISPEQFEASQRRELLTQKVREHLQQQVATTQDDVIAFFHRENDTINLDYAWLTAALVESKVQVNDIALEEYFNANQEDFRIPQRVSLRYLLFDPARYEAELGTFSEADMDRYYRRNLELFEVEEQVKAAHILLQLGQNSDPDTINKRRELAQDIRQQLREGADFAQLAKRHSDDAANAADGGDLGYFGRGIMVSEFETAAFALRPGQISDVVQTPFGFHIIKVTDYIAAGFKPLVDVTDRIKAGLTIEESRQMAYEKAMDAFNINRRGGDLDAAAKENDLGIKETGFFAVDEPINGLGRVEEIAAAAFSLQPGELARPIMTTNGVLLIALKDQQPSRLPELAEVKTSVEKAYREEQAQSLAFELARKLLELAREQQNLAAAADQLDLRIDNTGDFSRSSGYFIPRIGSSQELADAAFTLTEADPVIDNIFTFDNRYLVAALKTARRADFSALNDVDIAQLRERLLLEKKEQAVSDTLDELYQQAQIEIIAPELITAFQN
ncbi:SurA N-terminal domain-containing protein [Pelovirga terrestris]|uniref:Periplasmic chaperone PpiD n=1 Tax=Pelovirga terrestris TaxID=2771352 RepID=A0A8J6QLU7_9BACT|nr:SurA N-terminal domain-containing protein [Pelovirga terrestris]MBD1399368.1 SurA N-terminal domain-containing protein [Pelovirga terrestris]